MSDRSLFYYWVRGTLFRSWNEIEVSPETTIAEFKKRIIQLHSASVSGSISVYKVPEDKPVPGDDDSIEKNLGALSISMLGTPLLSVKKLSEYFEQPIPKCQLHLVIDSCLFVRCWYRGTESEASFMVKASICDQVDWLKNSIETKLHGVRPDVPASFMKLYKIMDTDDLPKFLDTAGTGQLLHGDQVLDTVFNDVPFSATPCVVIEPLRADEGLFRKSKPHPADGLFPDSSYLKGKTSDLEDADYDVIELAKRSKLATVSPSIISRPSNYRRLYEDPQNRIIDHRHLYVERPSSNEPSYPDDELPPISLQYEGFGHFLDIFSGREGVPGMEHVSSARLISAVDDFADLMSQTFPDETTRRDRGLTALNDIFSARTDLSWQFMPAISHKNIISEAHAPGLGAHNAPYCVIKFKDERGGVSSIPYVQMTSEFAHFIQGALENPSFVKLIKGWNVPCLGLTIVGQCVTFYAIIYFGRWRVVSITPGLSCISGSGQGADRISLYAAFKAASVFLAHVTKDVTTLVRNPPPEIRGSRVLPRISSLGHPHSRTRVEFEIHARIYHDKTTDRELYLAQTTDKKVIAVKFSRCYSFELHTFCADRGCAPALLGFERLPGGFFGIAMEFVEPACQLTQSPYVEKHGEWVKQLRELVEAFHDQDLVHGDLRSPNVISDGNRIMIIDFDWAGKLGEVSYPDDFLNPELTDGRDSKDRKITKGDDLRVLDRTLKSVLLDV